jgi:hypothetical protein
MRDVDCVYLDVCCLKRPFDDQRSVRVQLEAAAVAALLEGAERGRWALVRSPAHDLENGYNPREDRRLATALWLDAASVQVGLSDVTAGRAQQLAGLGFAPLDALHTAFAEAAGARWLATTDDRLIALGSRHAAALAVAIVNPIEVAGQVHGGPA